MRKCDLNKVVIKLAHSQVLFKELDQRLGLTHCRKNYFHRTPLIGLNRVSELIELIKLIIKINPH